MPIEELVNLHGVLTQVITASQQALGAPGGEATTSATPT
jgi:hypothetical protein